MLSIYRNMFKIPDLRGKIFFTLAMFGVYRLGATIPVPGHRPRGSGAVPVPAAGRWHLRVAQPLLRRGAGVVLRVRPRDHPLHHRFHHHAVADGRHPQAPGPAGGRRVGSEGHHPVDQIPDGDPGPDPVDRLHLSVPYRPVHRRHRPDPQLHTGSGHPHRPDDDGRYRHGHVARGAHHPAWGGQRDVPDHLRVHPQPVPLRVRPDLGSDLGRRSADQVHRDHRHLPGHDRGDHLRRPGTAPDPDPVRQAGTGASGHGRPVDLHPAQGEHRRGHPGHLRHLGDVDPVLDHHRHPVRCRLGPVDLPLDRRATWAGGRAA